MHSIKSPPDGMSVHDPFSFMCLKKMINLPAHDHEHCMLWLKQVFHNICTGHRMSSSDSSTLHMKVCMQHFSDSCKNAFSSSLQA